MTVKEFIGAQSEFAKKPIKFTVDGVPLTVLNYDILCAREVACWEMRIDRVIDLITLEA